MVSQVFAEAMNQKSKTPEDELLDKWGRDEKLLFVDVASAPNGVGIMDEEEWVYRHTKVPTVSTYVPAMEQLLCR